MNTTKVFLGGESRPVKFGFNALSEFSELTGRSIQQLNVIDTKDISMKDMLLLCWCALKQGARKEGQEFTATVEDVGDWLDDNPESLVSIVTEYHKARSGDPDRGDLKKEAPSRKSR
jgi:hypothetical protein